jgi:hypothetical protein
MKMLVGQPISTRGYSDARIQELIDLARAEVSALKDALEGRAYARPLRAAG